MKKFKQNKQKQFLKSCSSPLVNSLPGNLMEKAIELHISSPPYKLTSTAKKRLRASKYYSICGDTVNAYGKSVNAIAVWAGMICAHIRGKPHRYKILVVFYNRKHYIFAIPINMVDKSLSSLG